MALLAGGLAISIVLHRQPSKPLPAAAPPPAVHPAWPPSALLPSPQPSIAGPQADGDSRAEIAALRSRGVSEASIRQIITNELVQRRRREQYRAELLIEQRRYPAHYWEAPPPIETIAALERLRQSELARLDRETDGLLQDLFGAGVARPPASEALFGPDHPGPKIDFLPTASQRQLEELLFDRDPDGRMSSVDRLNLLRQVLTPGQFDQYAKWNSSAAVSLGTELVAFKPSQSEYDAIFRWQSVADSEQGFPTELARTEADAQLKAILGADRYAAFQHQQDPAYQTVVQVLNRWGLPLAAADSVLSMRQSAISAMNAIWQDPNLTDDQKAARVEKTRQQFRQQITSRLGLPAGIVPDDDLL